MTQDGIVMTAWCTEGVDGAGSAAAHGALLICAFSFYSKRQKLIVVVRSRRCISERKATVL